MAGENKGDKIPPDERERKKRDESVQESQPASPETPPEGDSPVKTHNGAPCPVVGVGASAGGLEALQGLFASMPPAPGVAFVVVQHRATDRTSVMRSLIEKFAKLRVLDIVDRMAVQPDTIYLAPADKDVSLMNGVLYLVEPAPHAGVHLPIDSFLRTLAQDEAERAIAVILSGTGSDGTLGLRAVKAAGGMGMAQKEDQAKYDSMPRSAIDTGMVDFVLPVEKMGEQLMRYVRHPYLERQRVPEAEEKVEGQLQKIFVLIRNETGHDFSHYKRNTIRRRIARRLAIHQIEDFDHYIKLLQENIEEVRTLAREMLITVTNFFRDPEAWEALREHVVRPLVAHKPSEVPIRIWVAGCATGEEAYTAAIVFQEQLAKTGRRQTLQVFATDLDEDAISVARRGVYPKSIVADVPAASLKRFFTEEGNSYRVKNGTREMLVFAKHNLIRDAPFSKLDLVCCRNVLIYMDTTLQKKLIPMFHYTLNPGGCLFLGESESIRTFADLFAPLDVKHKIFRHKPAEIAYEPQTAEIGFYPQPGAGRDRPRPEKRGFDTAKIVEQVILRDYSLPCVLVDGEFNALYFNGDTSRYLIQPGGKPTFNLLQMARPEVHYKLSVLLKRAFREKRAVIETGVQIRDNDHYAETDIVIRPVAEPNMGGNLMLVVFHSRSRDQKPDANSPAGTESETDARVRAVEQELHSTKEYLQTTIEELETSNEELKSSNEELQSTNEELQSTNEELDTSREELQSTNEELRTVNAEHQQKIDELSKAYDDLNNLLGATEVATLFLDHDLRIRRFTPAARRIFRLIDRDIGRPLDDISTTLQYPDLLADVRTVLDTLTRTDREIESTTGEWYHVKIVPYRTGMNIIEGEVITFLDISLAEAIVETVRQPLLILGKELAVIAANPAFYRHFRTRPEETIGRQIYKLGNGQWNIPGLRKLLEEIVPQDTKFEDFEVKATFSELGERTMRLNARQTMHQAEATGRILLAFEDVTDQAPGRRNENG